MVDESQLGSDSQINNSTRKRGFRQPLRVTLPNFWGPRLTTLRGAGVGVNKVLRPDNWNMLVLV